ERHFPALYEITITIVQSLKRQIVQRTMRHDHQLPSANLRLDGPQQSIVKRAQMFSRALRELREMGANLRRAVTQRVDLKTTALNLSNDVRFPSQTANNLDTFARNHKRHQLVIDRGVLNQRALGAQRRLQPRNREEIVSCVILKRATMLKLARDFKQLALALEQLAFEFGVGLPVLNRASHRTMHLVVE